ncbi:MAG: PAS domain-containing protein, partial [Alphaproteobacteria bacterium]|nr:PAS domain-containing protein [Alphaproteobacteria bacterium]
MRQRAQQLFASDTVVDEGQAARIRARQLQAVARLTPFAMLANLLNLSLVAVVFWGPGPRVFLAVWGATLVLIVARLLWTWRLERQRPARGVASKRALRRASVSAAALGLIWGTAPAALLPGAGAAEQVVIATVTTGMICAGGFILASTPWSATAFVLALSSGALAALSLSDFGVALPMAALLLIYAGIVIGGVWSTSRLFDARLLAEAEAERQKEVIGLLLRDFEEHTSDMLWEIDADGRLRNVSPRLASLFGQPVRALTAAPVLAILQRLVADGDAAPLVQLRQHLEAGTAVRELALAVRRGRRVRWWSLSAKPL